jgi:comEA protein
MQFLNFTPQEIRALIFLLTALLVGSGITFYKRTHPQFAPELVMEKSPPSSVSSLQTGDTLNEGEVKKKINLNQATSSELELLPGLGPKLSQRIVEYRRTNGEFQKLKDLMKVPGIGPKTWEQIKEYITVD